MVQHRFYKILKLLILRNNTLCLVRVTLPNGAKYVGEYMDGLLNGQGT